MRLLSILLMIAGGICFFIPSITFFTRERVADVGFFSIDMDKPHTILLNPGVGIALLVVGGILFLASGRRQSAL